ncbi:hypothetical protein CSKR_109778 [Clonorchis sinensis]|uniref:Uncharacterized protein n=1 Tax=Clonorchis sinensis TaxID=79923 RepID=A0A419QDF9_CLOSI|nr:hypothetical protein CSKR_109778 [Clonorchis sinensis]
MQRPGLNHGLSAVLLLQNQSEGGNVTDASSCRTERSLVVFTDLSLPVFSRPSKDKNAEHLRCHRLPVNVWSSHKVHGPFLKAGITVDMPNSAETFPSLHIAPMRFVR